MHITGRAHLTNYAAPPYSPLSMRTKMHKKNNYILFQRTRGLSMILVARSTRV